MQNDDIREDSAKTDAEEASVENTAEECLNDDKNSDNELEKLHEEIGRQKDQYLRLAAEYDNFRKRSQREHDSLYKEAKASTIETLLPIADNFERAMSVGGDEESFRKGIEMIFTQWNDVMAKLGVKAFGEEGDEFDPNIHHAVMQSDDEDAEENTITQVLQKGYKIGDKIIRAAMVAVKQ